MSIRPNLHWFFIHFYHSDFMYTILCRFTILVSVHQYWCGGRWKMHEHSKYSVCTPWMVAELWKYWPTLELLSKCLYSEWKCCLSTCSCCIGSTESLRLLCKGVGRIFSSIIEQFSVMSVQVWPVAEQLQYKRPDQYPQNTIHLITNSQSNDISELSV